jgi:hypothetical protein
MLAHMLRAGPAACCTAKLPLRLQGKLSSSVSSEGDTSQLPLLLMLLLLLLLLLLTGPAGITTMLLTVHVPSCRQERAASNTYYKIAGRRRTPPEMQTGQQQLVCSRISPHRTCLAETRTHDNQGCDNVAALKQKNMQ